MTRLLNMGCGSIQPKEWDNHDIFHFGQEYGFTGNPNRPFREPPVGKYDGIFLNHVMTAIPHDGLRRQVAYLFELLKPGGWVRIADADFRKMIDAAQWHRSAGKPLSMVSDEAEPTLEGKLCYWMTWNSTRKSAISNIFMKELLRAAGFVEVEDSAPRHTLSGIPQLTDLDDRENESWFVEARKPL